MRSERKVTRWRGVATQQRLTRMTITTTGVVMPLTDNCPNDDSSRLADVLDAGRGELLATYEERLTTLDSRLVATPLAREQCLTHAEMIIYDVLHELRVN